MRANGSGGGSETTSLSVEDVCQGVLDVKYSRPKYDKDREEEPEVFAKKKEYKVTKCVSQLGKQKEEHPKYFVKVANCVEKHKDYKKLDRCLDKAGDYRRDLEYTALRKKENKTYESAKYGVKLRAPEGAKMGEYNFIEYESPYFTVRLEQSKCGWSLQNDREKGGGPKATFNDEKWCAKGETSVRQIAKGKTAWDKGSKVTNVELLPNGSGTYIVEVERKSVVIKDDGEREPTKDIFVYLPRINDVVICKVTNVDTPKEEALARSICSSLQPI